MNIRNVLRTYTLLRQLTDDESALLGTLRNATDAERELLVETLAPQKSSTKRAGKKSASRGGSKSSRASGMAAAIAKNLNRPREGACAHVLESGAVCNTGDNNPIHDQSFGYAGYHEFDAGKSSAPRAGAKSSTNGGASDDEQVSAASGD